MRVLRRAAPVAAVLALAPVLAGCDQLPLFCRDTVVAGAPSPDGALIANLVVRDCHLTTGYTTHLTLRSSRELRTGPTVAVLSGARPPTLTWTGARRLVVSPDARSKVLYQHAKWDGVTLEYRPPGDMKSEGTR
jgi:ABC-type uncharacterized transport system auxiliary subunit